MSSIKSSVAWVERSEAQRLPYNEFKRLAARCNGFAANLLGLGLVNH